jgi:6-phosphofructokinase 2
MKIVTVTLTPCIDKTFSVERVASDRKLEGQDVREYPGGGGKVGAGDSMVGGLAAALVEKRPLDDAVRFGVAAGSAAVMNDGTELCRREDVERLYHSARRQEASR